MFSRKPLFGYKGMVFATLAIAALSVGGVGAPHVRHRRGAAAVLLAHDVPDRGARPGVKFVNWIGTLWRGKITFETPMLFALGFLVTFLFGGLTGVLLASPPLDFHVSDSYFVVAHFHYVLFGTIVFATFSGIYFWFPKMTGRMMDETLGKIHFWTTVHRVPHHVPGAALAGQRGHAAPLRRLPADRRVHHAERDLLDRRVHPGRCRRCRSCGTCSRATASAAWSPSTTRGASATRWSGPPRARRRGTTSPSCPGSGPSARRSSCTTPSTSSGSVARRTSAGKPSPYEVAAQATARETQPNERPTIALTISRRASGLWSGGASCDRSAYWLGGSNT